MFKKMILVFLRDMKTSKRDFMSMYIILAPIIFAVGINLLAPGINEATVNVALVEGENQEQATYLEDFAKVELFKDVAEVTKRVERRDDVIGILNDGSEYYLLNQGNETIEVLNFARSLLTYYEEDVQIENTTAVIIDLGRTVPPLKKLLVNIMIMMFAVLGGMLIAFNIIEEKVDKTIRAMNVSPISRKAFISGKSLSGIILPLYGAVAMLVITGFAGVNWGQMILLVLSSTIMCILIGFFEGLNNDDIISAAANIKVLFLPLIAAIAAVEFLSDKWQILFYWIPFYWIYKGNDAVLSYTSKWPQILMYTVIVVALSAVVYARIAPKIRKGLE